MPCATVRARRTLPCSAPAACAPRPAAAGPMCAPARAPGGAPAGRMDALEVPPPRGAPPAAGAAARHLGFDEPVPRAVLYFCHALMQSRERLSVFLFGTRLTNITRPCANAIRTRRSKPSPATCATGPAAPASAPRWPASTANGRAACWPAGPPCCWSRTASTTNRSTCSAARWRACAASPTASSGSTPAALRRFHAARARGAGHPAPRRRAALRPQPGQPVRARGAAHRRCRPRGRPAPTRRARRRRTVRNPDHGNEPDPASASTQANGLGSTERHRPAQAVHPGCESIEPDGDNAYLLALTAAIGPVGALQGPHGLQDIQAPDSYTIQFDGQAARPASARARPRQARCRRRGNAAELYGQRPWAARSRRSARAGRCRRAQDGRQFLHPLHRGARRRRAGSRRAGRRRQRPDSSRGGGGQSDEPKRKRSWTAWISKS